MAGGPLLFPDPEHFYLFNDYRTLEIACGQCHGCRMKRSTDWATRCMHEKQLHRHSAYITLTYNDEHLPENYNLRYRDFQLFMKRLRKAAFSTSMGRNEQLLTGSNTATTSDASSGPTLEQTASSQQLERHPKATPTIRFYMGGEYGERNGRPHYHALLFGIDFGDRKYLKTTPAGAKIYTSEILGKLWPHGFSSTADLTWRSAAYVARYVMKKRTGDGERNEYEILDIETGEIWRKKKEFNNMSRRPGIGKPWMEKFHGDVYTSGKVIVNGARRNPPRYYDKIYKHIDQLQLEHIQHSRFMEALAQSEHHTPERLAVQEAVALAKTKSLKRNL